MILIFEMMDKPITLGLHFKNEYGFARFFVCLHFVFPVMLIDTYMFH